jgi:hypothetical protein
MQYTQFPSRRIHRGRLRHSPSLAFSSMSLEWTVVDPGSRLRDAHVKCVRVMMKCIYSTVTVQSHTKTKSTIDEMPGNEDEQ